MIDEGVSKLPKTHNRGCVKTPKNSQSPDFPKPGLCYVQKFCTFRQKFQTMTKVHFRPYITNQLILFPQRIDEDIAENDPVRIISSVIDHLDISCFHKTIQVHGQMCISSQNDAQGYCLCLHEQHLFVSQDRKVAFSGYPFYMTGRI